MGQFSFEVLNRIDLPDLLSTIGIESKKRKAHCYCYLSHLAGQPQHRPTYIVNRRLKSWRETTTKQSGKLADLAVQLYDCTIGELKAILRSALPAVLHAGTMTNASSTPVIAIERTHPIRSSYLENFVWERRIPLHVAREYCVEAWYKRGNNVHATLTFRNYSRGFELFDRNHRYRLQPCRPTHIRHGSRSLAVFRHALDLLA